MDVKRVIYIKINLSTSIFYLYVKYSHYFYYERMGTTKATFHIPNYSGFIPSAKTVGTALEHATALEPRKVNSRAAVLQN